MKVQHIINQGVTALTIHKLRTFFMMIGTFVGVSSLTVIMAINVGTGKMLKEQVSKWSHNVIKVNAGGGKGYTQPQEGVITLLPSDAETIKNQVKNLGLITSVVERKEMQMKGNGKEMIGRLFAIEPNWHEVMKWPIKEGESITDEDIATMGNVCVIGPPIQEELFADINPIGEYIQVGNARFKIKGILKARGASAAGVMEDDRILIPLTTGLKKVLNQNSLSYMRMQVIDPDTKENNNKTRLENTVQQINALLSERHHITPPQEADFSIVYDKVVRDAVRPISQSTMLLLVLLSALSMIVGGIVLMNIMLIAVGERKNEIGLRRAIGATYRDIYAQFLSETLIVSISGIVAGGIVGWGAAAALASTHPKLAIGNSWGLFLLIVLFSLAVATVSGLYPARQAARLNPVEALKR